MLKYSQISAQVTTTSQYFDILGLKYIKMSEHMNRRNTNVKSSYSFNMTACSISPF